MSPAAPRPRRRRLLRHPATNAVGVALLLIVALAAGRIVADQLSDTRSADAPFTVRAADGERSVSLSYMDVAVTGVRATDTLVDRDEVETTTATFLVVDLEVRASTRSQIVAGLRLVGADGTVYRSAGTSRTGCSESASLPTGVRTYWMACFEVPDDALEGASVLVGRGSSDAGNDRRDEQAEIGLGIDSALADRFAGAVEPLPAFATDLYPYDTTPVEVEP